MAAVTSRGNTLETSLACKFCFHNTDHVMLSGRFPFVFSFRALSAFAENESLKKLGIPSVLVWRPSETWIFLRSLQLFKMSFPKLR